MIGLAECRYGMLAYFTADQWLGRSLRELGEWSESEVALWKIFLRPGMTVVDVGANIGAHAVALARIVGVKGVVYAFEPQPLVYEVAVTNKILNRLWQIDVRCCALGSVQGTAWYAPIDYATAESPGGVAFAADWSVDPHELGADMRRLDQLELGRIDFIKIDVEGMEREVLEGAAGTIARDRPILYCENDRYAQSAGLLERIEDFGYTPRWHLAPLWNRDNFRGKRVPPFEAVSANLLCIPPGMELLVPGTLSYEEAELQPDNSVRLLTT